MDLSKFQSWLVLNRNSTKTHTTYLYEVGKFLRQYPELNQDNVNSYLECMVKDGKKENTFNITMSALKAYSQFLKVEIDYPKQKKAHDSRAVNKLKKWAITEEELQEIIQNSCYIFGHNYSEYDMLLNFMFYSGLRLEEVEKLQVSNINVKHQAIEVIYTKGKVDRVVKILHKKTWNRFVEFIENKHDKVFSFNQRQIKYMFQKIQDYFGWEEFSPIYMRRSCARWLQKIGVPPIEIQRFLGHKDLKTTEGYLNNTVTDFLSSLDKYQQ